MLFRSETMSSSAVSNPVSKKKKFVREGLFYAELNELLKRELAEDGYSGVEVRVTPRKTKIIIKATRTQNVLGDKGIRIRQLKSVVSKRFNFGEGEVELYAEKIQFRGLSAVAQAESIRYKLMAGLAVRKACYGVLRFIMENGAKGCELIVSGKLRAQRAKAMKFKDGYMIKTGNVTRSYIDRAVRHVYLRQGVLGIKVKIMMPWDPTGRKGPKIPQPDVITVFKPKELAIVEPTPEGDDNNDRSRGGNQFRGDSNYRRSDYQRRDTNYEARNKYASRDNRRSYNNNRDGGYQQNSYNNNNSYGQQNRQSYNNDNQQQQQQQQY